MTLQFIRNTKTMPKNIHLYLNQLKSRIKKLFNKKNNFIYILEGLEKNTKQPLKLLFVGYEEDRNYFSQLVYGKEHKITVIKVRKNYSHEFFLENYDDCDLIMTSGNVETLKNLTLNNTYFIPRLIDGRACIQKSLAEIKSSSSVKRDLQRIRKNKLQYRISRKASDFDKFYDNMYLPYIKNTFNDCAIYVSKNLMNRKIGTCELLMIEHDGMDIAGSTMIFTNAYAKGWFSGIKDGDRKLLKIGASAAIYYFELQYALSKGYDTYYFGGSRAFLNDGVLQYKKKWGFEVCQHGPKGFLFTLNKPTTAAMSFLENNPFIIQTKNKFEGMFFLQSSTDINDSKINEIVKKYHFNGLSKLNIITPDPLDPKALDPLNIPDSVHFAHFDKFKRCSLAEIEKVKL